jgi:hypothetical protein
MSKHRGESPLVDLNDATTDTGLLQSVHWRAHVTASPVQQVAAVIDIGRSASLRTEEALLAPHHPRCSVPTAGCASAPTQPLAPHERTREQLSRSEFPGLQRGGSGGRRGLSPRISAAPRRNAGLPRGQIRLSRGFPAPRVVLAEGWILRRKAREGKWEPPVSWFLLAEGLRPSLFLSHIFFLQLLPLGLEFGAGTGNFGWRRAPFPTF